MEDERAPLRFGTWWIQASTDMYSRPVKHGTCQVVDEGIADRHHLVIAISSGMGVRCR